MSVYIIYGKRIGKDKTFRALNSKGVRVNKLSEAMAYATKEDALEVLESPMIKQKIKEGLLEFDVRKG